MFPVNLVLQMGELRRRLLWCDTELVIWIDIDSSLAFPESASVAELEGLLIAGELKRIDDPFLDVTLREVEAGSSDQQKRDSAWDMLAETVRDTGLFERRARGEIVKGIMERHGVTQGEIVNILLKIKNSFLPTKQILIGL